MVMEAYGRRAVLKPTWVKIVLGAVLGTIVLGATLEVTAQRAMMWCDFSKSVWSTPHTRLSLYPFIGHKQKAASSLNREDAAEIPRVTRHKDNRVLVSYTRILWFKFEQYEDW
jgi:hypothetical protein